MSVDLSSASTPGGPKQMMTDVREQMAYCYFQRSTVSLSTCKEYLNVVTCKTPALVQKKYQTFRYVEGLSISSYT